MSILPLRRYALALFLVFFALPVVAASLVAGKTEIAVGETVTVTLRGKPLIAVVTSWSAEGGLEMVENDSERAIVKGAAPGDSQVKVKLNGKTYRASIKVTAANAGQVQLSVDQGSEKEKDEFIMKLEGWGRVRGLANLEVQIARMLYEVNTGARSPKAFYENLARLGGNMFDVIAVRSKLVDNPDPAIPRQVMGPTFEGGGTPVEKTLLTWRRDQTKAAIDEVVKRFVDSGRVPANGYNLLISHVGKWANQADVSLTFTGDIDFSFVSNDTAITEAMKAMYAEVIQRRTGLDPKALDSVCTAHGKAGLEVYIGRHGMAFAEEQMKINELVDMSTGQRTRISGDDAVKKVGTLLTLERHLSDLDGLVAPKPAVETEPGLSMEMVRHFDHDIAKTGIYDLANSVVKAAKYLDRSYKALIDAGGAPGNPDMARFAGEITRLANTKPQTAASRNEMTRLISDFLGSAPHAVWDLGSQKFQLTIDQGRVAEFHRSATRALWDTVKQGSNTRTAALDQRLRDLLEAQKRGDNVEGEVNKLRQDMVDLVDMVEAEVKAAHGMDIPVEVHTNNAKVKAMLETLSKRFGVKALSPDELKDKKFVEELLRAQADHPDPSRLEALKSYVMDKAARSAEMSMKGVEKVNNIMDFIDDGLLGTLRGDGDFAAFEAEMKTLNQTLRDPKLRPEGMSRLGAMKTRTVGFIKKANKTYNDALQATAAGRQGMKLMMVYGLADEMKSYRDAWNDQGWSGMATEVFRRRIPFGSAVESAVMGNTLRAGWDVVTTLIPPLGLPEAAIGLGQAIGAQYHATYWNEQLALFSDTLYESAKFKLMKVDSHDTTKVGEYRLVEVKYRGIPIDLAQFAEQTRDQVDALRQQVGRGRLDWAAYQREFTGLSNWMEVDRTFQHTLSAGDPVLQLLDEMANHPAVGPRLMDRLAEKGLVRWEEIKLGYLTNLIKRLEDRKQADQALGAGQLPEMFRELKETAADLGIEKQVMAGLDAEVDTNNLKKLMNWLWDVKRAALEQAPTESETNRAAQVVKRYLDAYREVKQLRGQAEQQLGYGAGNDGATRYLTGEYFLSGRAEPDLKAARAWMQHIPQSRAAADASLLEVKRALLPNVGLDDQEDKRYQGLLLPHQLWMKPYRDWAGPRNDLAVLDYAVRHDKERRRILADYKDLLTRLAPVQLTVTLSDASGARKTVGNASARLSPSDALGKATSASGSGRLVLGAPSGRYSLNVEAPGFFPASRDLVLGRNLDPAPRINIALKPTGKPTDPKDDQPDAPDAGGAAAPAGPGAAVVPGGGAAGSGQTGGDGPLSSMACGNPTGVFDKELFNGLQVRYGISGICIGPYSDSDGFTHSRIFKILGVTGDSITVSGSVAPWERDGGAPCHSWAGSFWYQTDVSLTVAGKTTTYSSPKPCERPSETMYKVPQPAYSFNLSLPVPKDQREVGVSVSIRQTYVNPRFGDRGVVVQGSGTTLRKVAGSFPQGGQDGAPPPPALQVSLDGPKDTVQLGQPLTFSARTEGGKPPYHHSWSGAEGSGASARLTPKKPGELTVEVSASDSAGQTAKASGKLKVEAPKLVLNGITGQAIYGGKARLSVSGLPGVTAPADPCAGRSYTARGECEQNAAGASAEEESPAPIVDGKRCTPGASCRWLCSSNYCNCVCPPTEWAPGPGHCQPGEKKMLCGLDHGKECAKCPVPLKRTPAPSISAPPDRPAGAPRYRFNWQSTPGLGFDPATSENAATTVTYDRMGQVKVWCEVLVEDEGAWVPLGETEQLTVSVGPPRFELIFSPPQGQGMVGQPIRASLRASPDVPSSLIDYRWLEPPTGNRSELTQPASEIEFRARDANKPVALEALARAPYHGDEIARISGSYTGKAYTVRVTTQEPLNRPMIWDPARGGLQPVPKDAWLTDERIALRADLSGGPPPATVRWRWRANEGTSLGNDISQTPSLTRREAGTASATVEAVDGEGTVLGSGGISLNVIAPPQEPGKPSGASGQSGGVSSAADGGVWMSLDTSPGMYRQERSGNRLTVSKQGRNPGGLQHSGQRMRLDQPVSGDFDAQVAFSNARIEGGLNQIELQASFADGSLFYVVRDREGGGSHIWAPGLQGNASCGASGVLSLRRLNNQVTGYCDGRPIWSAERRAPLTSLQFVLQNNGSNDSTSVTFSDWRFNAAAAAGAKTDISGRWKTSEGEMTLVQQGASVTGRYSSDNGEIAGQMSGNVLEGWWIEDSANERCATAKNGRHHWGRIRYVFDGGKFTGQWSYCDKPLGGGWSGERIGAAPGAGPGAGGGLSSLKLTDAVPNTSSDRFRAHQRKDLTMHTGSWDRTPYFMTPPREYDLQIARLDKACLAGDARGGAGWNVDNFLLLELFDASGAFLKATTAGAHEGISRNGQRIPEQANGHHHGACSVDLRNFLPVGKPFRLKASAMDYGGEGFISEVWLALEGQGSASPVGAAPAQGSSANLARGKPASQSSTSQWSRANDAQGAVDGVINGGFGFHSNHEANPWWQVDLGGAARIDEVRLYNRLDCCPERARTVQVLLSDDGRSWRGVYRHNGQAFGGKDGKPLKIALSGERGRYMRLQLNETQWFHLDEVEVYGVLEGAAPPVQERDPRARVLFESGNIGGTQNGPTQPTRITLEGAHHLTQIENYHWNSARGAPGGSIALRGDDGRLYGPWPVRTRPGQGGAPNAYWTANPDETVPGGTYTVVDSDPASWSHNGQSGGRGFTRLEGYPADGYAGGRDYSSDPPPVREPARQEDEVKALLKGLKGLFK